jgi:putative DNA methylase
VAPKSGRKAIIPIHGEWIGEHRDGERSRLVTIGCTSSTEMELPEESLDAVFTDPPYFGNVQYGELMDFCYVWLRRLVGRETEGFDRKSTRSADELTGNATQARGLLHFTEGVSAVYQNMARALKPGAPLAFTYHHNRIEAYHAIAVAILDAGLACTAALPCPAEMGGSIHIHGTGSSIVDTVFVCRKVARGGKGGTLAGVDELAGEIGDQLARLRAGGVKPSAGDIRCIVFGHLARIAVNGLQGTWDRNRPTDERLARVAGAIASFGDSQALIDRLDLGSSGAAAGVAVWGERDGAPV